ncbi:transposase [Reticulibacter mediterranei]|uniref:Transposase n=1 Tax=Reticulibacter mediterranei TaxID=2778369 RepID=A0A8J3IWU4_9CHLR|nr:ISL3 family transposase [Reticulibacter mediterranei]GHO96737.1 transposase [Reticulibacter mediterranei]GHO97516.1 transposase [Reticulibacter mediterranei]GHP00063.1 transposase [Reticulibacter mediterranei]GHP00079.1 transposase [Reticulibacter mediterranei]
MKKREVLTPLALPEELEITEIEMNDEIFTLTAHCTRKYPCCPLCGTPAQRFHSHYFRRITDLPSGGMRVCLQVLVRKCFCDVNTCVRKIFAERLAPFAEPLARVTTRLFQVVQALGLATGGMLGARLAERIGIKTSWMTVLRRIMALPFEPVEPVQELGIDDFAWKRGRKWGTILVDMQSHKVIDILPDRSAETAAAWIAAHSEIELISRDRGGDYASAAKTAAPQAIQCADRFHVLKNLGEALEGLLARHLAAHRRGQAETSSATPLSDVQGKQPPRYHRSHPKAAELSQAKREERLAQYEQVVALRKQGFSQTAIANRIGIAHSTVSRWLRCDTFPERQPPLRKTGVDAYLSFLRERWEAGCHNIMQVYRELLERGYKGSYQSVYDQVFRLLPGGTKNATIPCNLSAAPLSSRSAAFLFLRQPEALSTDEQQTLITLKQLDLEIELAYNFVRQFALMLHMRTGGEQLDAWLESARGSQVRELQGFVKSVERDKAAVLAGLTLPQNNGLVEGHVNKLKLLKRMGYGRASFKLLRQRVLHAL